MENIDEIKYQEAVKRVKKIKGFYTHLLVYVVINLAILISTYNNINENQNFWRWHTFSTVFFWGIGLAAHGFSVFVPTILLGKNWEDNKIKELMDKEKNKWE